MDPRLDPPPGALVRAIARMAHALFPLPAKPPPLAQIRSVLVVRTDDRVGNALLTLPLVRALQAALPQARVDLLVAARRVHLVEGLPNLRAIGFEKRAGPLRHLRFLRGLRARYDVVIDAAHWHAFSLTSALLSRWAARRWVVGADRGPSRLVYSGIAPLPDPGTPDVVAKLRLGAPLGLRLSPAPMETALGRGPSPAAGRYAALNPGARKQDHRWPAAGFASFARKLQRTRGIDSVVFWGPGEEALAREVVAAAGGSAALAPPTDLDQLAAAFRGAALVVTNDTGPMHLAVACGAAVIAVFLDDAGLRWAHPGPRFEAVVAPADETPLLAAAGRLLDTARPPEQPPWSREDTP
ncbi:MAG: glycosyltransferase family 9 protein [Deltaproteobacteria bacterium]|nr:MAG: glycosyltransferase family 9 protein [Deltaproteobacteria bacterium]